MSRFLNPELSVLAPYIPGEQPRIPNLIKLNTNELPYSSPALVSDAVIHTASQLHLYCDPEAVDLRSAIAEKLQVPSQNILVSNGSDEALAFAFQAFCPLGAVYADVTYGFYRVLSKLYRLESDIITLRADFTVSLPDFARSKKTVFIANPNAPTGLVLSHDEIIELLEQNLNRLVVVDEAYVAFCEQESVVHLTKKYDNLLIIGTFSKAYGLAGARLGYAVGNQELINDLHRVRSSFNPYSVNTIAQAAGIAALQENNYYLQCHQKLIATRDRVQLALRVLGFECTDSRTNFIFVHHRDYDAKSLFTSLREHNILVRWFDTPRLSGHLRITVGTDAEMDVLLAALSWLLVEE